MNVHIPPPLSMIRTNENHIKIGVFLAPPVVKQSKFFRAISTKASKKSKRPRPLKKQKGHTPQ